MNMKRRSTENRVVVEMTTAKALTGKEAAWLVNTALSPRVEFEAIETKQFKRVVAKLNGNGKKAKRK